MDHIKFFDSHFHLHSDFFNKKEDGEKIAQKMLVEGVSGITVGVNFEDSLKAAEFSSLFENIFFSIGQHPTEKDKWNEEKYERILDKKTLAIGECGLDYYWPGNDLKKNKISLNEFLIEKERQKLLFEKQVYFSLKHDLPLILHVRPFEKNDAFYDIFEILDKIQKESGKIKALFHFFTSDDKNVFKEILKRGFYISFPGVVTFSNLDWQIKNIPLDRFLVESDSPFAAPVPYRGKINLPLYTIEVLKKISEIKKENFEFIRKKSLENSFSFFDL